MRIAVQVTQLREEVEPEPVTPPVVEPKLKEQVITKQLLTAKNDTPPESEDMFVLEQPPEVKDIEPEIVPEPPKPEVVPEPIPEPIKVEPKKIKKVEPKPKPKPKKVIKPQEAKPVVKPKAAEVVEAVKDSPIEAVEGTKEELAVESSNKSLGGSSSSSITDNSSADGEAENSRGSANEVTKNEAWKGYGQLLYAMVSKNKTYPQMAIRRHLEGRTMVSVRFDKGRMVDMTVLGQGSGHTVLDKAAREMVEKAIKSLPVRGDLAKKSFSVIVPVDFRLTN
jgi:protein TonB